MKKIFQEHNRTLSITIILLAMVVLFSPAISQENPDKTAVSQKPNETEETSVKKEQEPYEKLILQCVNECMGKSNKIECQEIKKATLEKVDKYIFCNESATYEGKEYDEYGREITNRFVADKRCPVITQQKTMWKLYRQLFILSEKCPSAMGGKSISEMVPPITDEVR